MIKIPLKTIITNPMSFKVSLKAHLTPSSPVTIPTVITLLDLMCNLWHMIFFKKKRWRHSAASHPLTPPTRILF